MSSRQTRSVVALVLVSLVVAGCSEPATPEEAERSSPTGTAISPQPEGPAPDAEPLTAPVRGVFFGMHDGRVSGGTTPPAPVGSLRFWDSGTSWLHLETSPGQFTWTAFDTAVSASESVRADPLLVMGQTPTFYASRPDQEAPYGPGAASMPDPGAWRRYVTAVAERYGDRIDYQIWNEANVVQYWAGSPQQLARLTVEAARIIHEVAPKATVVAPPFALRLKGQRRTFEKFWSLQSKGIDLAGAVDVVAVHLYPAADEGPEAQVELLDGARAVLAEQGVALPIWNTEINFGLLGGPEPPPISEELQRAFLMRTYILNAAMGIERTYWYSWNIGRIANTYMTTEDLATETIAGQSFDVVRKWLEGTRHSGCEVESGMWVCEAVRAGKDLQFVWRAGGGATDIGVTRGTTWSRVDGSSGSCSRRTCTLEVGETPTMLVAGG